MKQKTWTSVVAVALSAGALTIAGCGGGGGGGNKSNNPAMLTDEFNGTTFNTGTWDIYRDTSEGGLNEPLGRTKWNGDAPQIVTQASDKFARLRFDTYNAKAPGTYFRGQQIQSKKFYPRGNGLVMEARMRFVQPANQAQPDGAVEPITQRGLVAAFFGINERYLPGTDGKTLYPDDYYKSEIDAEVLSNSATDSPPRAKVWTNVWNDYNPGGDSPRGGTHNGSGYNNGVQNQDAYPQANNFDFGNWNTYRIEWKPGQTRWFVGSQLIRTEDAASTLSPGKNVDPDDPLRIQLNIWSASPASADVGNFGADSSFNAESDPTKNRTFYLDVDYVRITPLGTSTGAATSGANPLGKMPAGARSSGSAK